jgi:hypothetical protein
LLILVPFDCHEEALDVELGQVFGIEVLLHFDKNLIWESIATSCSYKQKTASVPCAHSTAGQRAHKKVLAINQKIMDMQGKAVKLRIAVKESTDIRLSRKHSRPKIGSNSSVNLDEICSTVGASKN